MTATKERIAPETTTSNAPERLRETFIARTYREYLRVERDGADADAGRDRPLTLRAIDLRMAVSTAPAWTLDDLLIKLELIHEGLKLELDDSGSAYDRADLAAASTLLSDLRRLKAAPDLFTSGTGAEDPILPLYREWWAGYSEFERLANLEEHLDCEHSGCAECDAALKRKNDALDALMEMAPTTRAGLAALAHVAWCFWGPGHPPTEAKACEGAIAEDDSYRFITTVWRFAAGLDGYPRHVGGEDRS